MSTGFPNRTKVAKEMERREEAKACEMKKSKETTHSRMPNYIPQLKQG